MNHFINIFNAWDWKIGIEQGNTMIDSVRLIFEFLSDLAHPINNDLSSSYIWRSWVVYFASIHSRYHLFKDFIERCVTLKAESSLLSVRIVHWCSYCLCGHLAVCWAFTNYKKPAILTITTDIAANLNRWVFLRVVGSIVKDSWILIFASFAFKFKCRFPFINKLLTAYS